MKGYGVNKGPNDRRGNGKKCGTSYRRQTLFRMLKGLKSKAK